jgi:hypothetical protein
MRATRAKRKPMYVFLDSGAALQGLSDETPPLFIVYTMKTPRRFIQTLYVRR